MATRATTTVMGATESGQYQTHLLTRLRDEWLNVSGGGGDAEQAAPDAQPGQNIVDFRLREQALGFRNIVDDSQSRLIARGGLLVGGAGGRNLNRVLAAIWRAPLSVATRAIPLRAQIDGDLLRACSLRPDGRTLLGLIARGWRADRESGNVTVKPSA